jgi:glutathione S-transferase
MIRLYGAALSPFVRKVRVALREKALPYEHIHVDPNRLPANFFDLSPLGRIPALEDGNHKLADSGVICQYLDAKQPSPGLYPQDPYLRARTLWLEKFADYELAPLCTFAIFRNRIVLPLLGKPCDETKIAQALSDKLPPLLDYLESELDEGQAANGESFSVADIAIASQFVNLQHGGERADTGRWPKLCHLIERTIERSSFAILLKEEAPVVAKIRAKFG